MSKICPKCGKEYDENELNCPYCPVGNVNDVIEVAKEEVLPEPTSVVDESTPIVTEVEVPTNVLPLVEETHHEEPTSPVIESPVIETPGLVDILPTNTINEIIDDEPILKAESSGLEATILEEVSVSVSEDILEPAIENEEIETVSISTPESSLEEEKEEFVIPEMPAPVVGEINPELLGNKYDSEEELNNQRIEAKKQKEALEAEKLRQEAELKSQTPMEKPDLLARIPDTETEGVELTSTKKKGKPMRKVLNAIIVILGIAVVAAAVWYFFLQDKDAESETNYMDPISTYMEGYKESDAGKMLSSFVSCVSSTDEITAMINASIQTRQQYKEVNIEYKETNVEVVNNSDQAKLDEYLKNACGTETPKIEDYKQVYVEQKIKTEQDIDFVVNNPKFWNVKINNEWYILMVE